MPGLAHALAQFRHDPRIVKLPPYLSGLFVVIGALWLALLPSNEYSRQTYVSENALLPGQVHTYFGGSEHNVFRAYRHEAYDLLGKSPQERSDKLVELLEACGLKVGRQNYEYKYAGEVERGQNVYAVLRAPRGDATEAIVLIGAWKNMDDAHNFSGLALVLTLASYFKRWSLWSKDIIFLLPPDSVVGPQAWVDAYHDSHDPRFVQPLTIKSGALQGALAVDYPAGPWGHRFDKLHVLYDGVNGQLANLDLFNTAVSIASNQMGIGVTLQRMWHHTDSYSDRLLTMLRGMLSQGIGYVSGPHSAFIPYHVDAITIQTVGDGQHDEISLGRTVESLCRSLNNLLEHLHQSFFFYLLMQANRFVSIGTYLPSAMLIAASFSITSIILWMQSGREANASSTNAVPANSSSLEEKSKINIPNIPEEPTPTEDKSLLITQERQLLLPAGVVACAHLAGLLPLYVFNNVHKKFAVSSFAGFAISTIVIPQIGAYILSSGRLLKTSHQQLVLIQCFSLLLLGLFLSALATLNFSLSFIVGLSSALFAFIRPSTRTEVRILQIGLLSVTSPPIIMGAAVLAQRLDVKLVIMQASFGWHVSGMWTQVIVWLVWWPSWVVAATITGSGFYM